MEIQTDGSSPQLRGTWKTTYQRFLSLRFIPAAAGNIVCCVEIGFRVTVHPRSCGEHDLCHAAGLDVFGSSPQLRGTCFSMFTNTLIRRFIPAAAGNMGWFIASPFFFTVHPRSCGEHTLASSFMASSAGSSPQLRGTYFL